MSEEKELVNYIPDSMYDEDSGKTFKKGKFLGEGAFAKCYEIQDSHTENIFAAKVVSKSLIIKNKLTDKINQEILILSSLNHRHIVGYYGFFHDSFNVYIILELCRNRSLRTLQRRRKILTEYEIRYYLKQLLEGVYYLHKNKIIHRDLKLENIFLNDDLLVKIGDFGLAAKLQHKHDKEQTFCGTPKYVAPEMLTKVGHSYEVDVWGIGCIAYVLLIGKHPFQEPTVLETYTRILNVKYQIPGSMLDTVAMRMIYSILQGDPKQRPTVAKLLKDPFLTSGFMPKRLPASCLTTAPCLKLLESYNQHVSKPLSEMNISNENENDVEKNQSPLKRKKTYQSATSEFNCDINVTFKTLEEQLNNLLKSIPDQEKPSNKKIPDEITNPDIQHFIWVTKWIDNSKNSGFCYQLSDDTVNIFYNDDTHLKVLSNNFNIHYTDECGYKQYFTVKNYPSTLNDKMKKLNFLLGYMITLKKTGDGVAATQCDSLERSPYMHMWFRTETSVFMVFTNGYIQINFINDHTKIILCPSMGTVCYIDQRYNFRTYSFEQIKNYGCCFELKKYLEYVLQKLTWLWSGLCNKTESGSAVQAGAVAKKILRHSTSFDKNNV